MISDPRSAREATANGFVGAAGICDGESDWLHGRMGWTADKADDADRLHRDAESWSDIVLP